MHLIGPLSYRESSTVPEPSASPPPPAHQSSNHFRLSVPTMKPQNAFYTIGLPAQSFPHQVPEYLFKVHRNPEALVLTKILPLVSYFNSQPPHIERGRAREERESNTCGPSIPLN